ncbi:MAG: hypothetical protein BGO70_15790 [Bacteroidetes bacterium 43-93]|jgi:hypothetical protein|nr:hypothetical protein [Bacteroidota bacterium]OJX01234.1 MAG: hypothetical protein BGO70_15790 [Bacteroidetes bacterium 43-93]
MKKTAIICLFPLAIAFASCGNSTKDNVPGSTPIDSTNLNGTAPATYDAQDPAMPDSPRSQGANESGLRANTASSEDSAKMRQ